MYRTMALQEMITEDASMIWMPSACHLMVILRQQRIEIRNPVLSKQWEHICELNVT